MELIILVFIVSVTQISDVTELVAYLLADQRGVVK